MQVRTLPSRAPCPFLGKLCITRKPETAYHMYLPGENLERAGRAGGRAGGREGGCSQCDAMGPLPRRAAKEREREKKKVLHKTAKPYT